MSRITAPMGQKLHTNLIVVRLKAAKQQFEIAAYPNKVQEWRAGMCSIPPAPPPARWLLRLAAEAGR